MWESMVFVETSAQATVRAAAGLTCSVWSAVPGQEPRKRRARNGQIEGLPLS